MYMVPIIYLLGCTPVEAFTSTSQSTSSLYHVQNVRQRTPTTCLHAAQVNEGTPSPSSTQNLYEILNSPTDATRAELKRNYIKLVRKTHPDALIAVSNNNENESSSDDPEFQEIMNAWRTLSNPLERKRYDRKLRAEKFTTRIETVVGTIGKTAGPQFLDAFENVALPFIRRSAATTVAGFTAVSEDLAQYGNDTDEEKVKVKPDTGIGGIFSNAMKASQKAGKAIDRLELMEKSKDLEARGKMELAKALEMKEELTATMNKRVKLTLHTPNTEITSLEALMILDGLNTIDEVSMVDIMRLRHTVSYEIEQLQEIEKDFQEKKNLKRSLERDMDRTVNALDQARANAKAAEQAEERARKALEDAKNLVASTKKDIEQAAFSLQQTGEIQTFNEYDVRRVQQALTKQQSKVRVALRRKQEAIEVATEKVVGDYKASEAENSEKEIQSLLKAERYLRAEQARLEAVAQRLLSRSKKLEITAEELEKEEEIMWEKLEEGVKAAERAAKNGYDKHD